MGPGKFSEYLVGKALSSLQALALIPLYKREPSIIYFMGSKSLRILVQNTFTYKGERQSNKDKETLQQIMFRFIV